MCENKFVKYLNTLHNYNAQNSNVFSEKNIKSDFYKKVLVDIPICNYIVKKLSDSDPCLIVLTGHAGDGKTSLMYQVLEKLNQDFDRQSKSFEISLKDNKKCICIKDYSEFTDEEKKLTMKKMFEFQKNGKFVFLVANTGPLISNFSDIFDERIKDDVESSLINLLDKNSGEVEDFFGLKVCLINVVAINNMFFSNEFIEKIIADDLWSPCNNCHKKDYCPILRNVNLIKSNKQKVKEFIYHHYIWLSEYGERLTIRSMTQQLSFMLTGGLDCADVKDYKKYIYLSSNLFFGYRGIKEDKKALNIKSVGAANLCHYDKKRWRAEEDLFINSKYSELFENDLVSIIDESNHFISDDNELQNMIKRMYLFYNTEVDDNKNSQSLEDIFSAQFERFVAMKFRGEPAKRADSGLLGKALTMLNVGCMNDDNNEIPITLSRESGYMQNVQLVVGMIRKGKIKLVPCDSSHSKYFGENDDIKYRDIIIEIDRHKLKQQVTLPLLDYFNELKRGIINTNIDSQLSKGIENMKSEILSIVKNDPNDDEVCLLLLDGNSYKNISMLINEDGISYN